MNIWIQNSKSKTCTFEIVKNAMLRYTPRKVKILETHKNKIILNMIEFPISASNELDQIIKEVNLNDLSYNGKLRIVKDRNEIKVMQIKPIKKMNCFYSGIWILEIDF